MNTDYVVDLPATPTIIKISSESTSITITWEQDLFSDVLGYEIQYNFTIRKCPGNSWNVWNVTISDSSLRNYTLVNSTVTPVEEDSDYFIMFSAVNSNGKSEPVTIETNTLASGIQCVHQEILMILSCLHIYSCSSCLLYTSPSPRDATLSRMPSSA